MPGNTPIHVHYIGGRAGSTNPFMVRAYADDFVFHIYDADPACIEQVTADPVLKNFHFTNEACIVGATGSKRPLNINYDPFTSSVYPLNPSFTDGYTFASTGDYVIGETFRTVSQHDGRHASLEEICEARGCGVDFLFMDTQGGELDILIGAGDRAATELVGFQSEVEFEELYAGQPLFGDIHGWARSNGFRFVHLDAHPDCSWHRAPLGWRGKGALFSGEALFLKDPAWVAAHHRDPGRSLRKAALIGLLLGRIEYSLECIGHLSGDDEGAGTVRYAAVIDDIRRLHAAEEGLYPPSFADVFSQEESMARFDPNVPFERIWDIDPASVRRRYFAHVTPERFLATFPTLLSPALTPFERLLVSHDLRRTALLVQARRLEQAQVMAKLLGLGVVVDGTVLVDEAEMARIVRGG